MLDACHEGTVLCGRHKRTVHFVDVGDTSYAFIVPNVNEGATIRERFVGVASEDERRLHDVYFDGHACVGMDKRTWFCKKNVLAVKASQI